MKQLKATIIGLGIILSFISIVFLITWAINALGIKSIVTSIIAIAFVLFVSYLIGTGVQDVWRERKLYK